MTDPKPGLGLLKQHSWSPDTERDEAWLRRKGLHRGRRGRPERSVTDDDLDELRGCIDLGFGFEIFDPPATGGRTAALTRRLSETFPALDLYYAVHRSYCDSVAQSTPLDSSSSSSADDGSPMDSSLPIFSPGSESPTRRDYRRRRRRGLSGLTHRNSSRDGGLCHKSRVIKMAASTAFRLDPFIEFRESPEAVKARLKQWAQVVACSVRQRY